jgi:hypothetical protein
MHIRDGSAKKEFLPPEPSFVKSIASPRAGLCAETSGLRRSQRFAGTSINARFGR